MRLLLEPERITLLLEFRGQGLQIWTAANGSLLSPIVKLGEEK
jgi:hypothetical protein